MASRPAMAALGCLQCRIAALRAVASASRPALRSQAAPSRIIRSSVPATRSFTSARTGGALQAKDTDPELQEKPDITTEEHSALGDAIDALEAASIAEADASAGDKTAEASSETPWYLQVDAPVHAPTQHVPTLPTVPDGAPPILEHMMKFAYEEMGLDDLELLDLREMDPPPALGPNLLMLFGTARGERHLHVSSSRLVKWLRNNRARRGDRVRQIQTNVEYLLTHAVTACPSEVHLLRLLEAYHRQKNLDRFWQTWRTPPRHGAPRGPLLYRYMFERAAMLKRRDWCIEVLRHCAPEMMHEAPPVLPVGEVWKALRACLLVVDAGAEALAETPPVLRETTPARRSGSSRGRPMPSLSRCTGISTRRGSASRRRGASEVGGCIYCTTMYSSVRFRRHPARHQLS
ncbi:conserved hypothetical protein [Verticillium alfalfae VaMs.102]|uniref:ATPase synthesis protein 25 n=1 Tax=Verticillium alfalfae (strain VaMs.102 / ATCC MYA-4576 / FGSC 10136) TaxID=526221 RepID=C9S6T9_VERA1|nr:conserved hypothetical protein [Verticillium alfalfae VaMs.102]EEY15192.1 conserved hypothetical protein [Verticillium alfalfae VaMs.102]